jgi:glucan biosynthesis protein
MKMRSRRSTLTLIALCLAALHSSAVSAFDFEDVARKAESQARRPYRPPSRQAPPELQALTYDEYMAREYRARLLPEYRSTPYSHSIVAGDFPEMSYGTRDQRAV